MSGGIRDDSLKLCEAKDEVFKAFGRVAYAVQIFESDLITLLIMLEQITHVENSVKTDPESFLNKKAVEKWWQTKSKIIEKELDRYTLGQLVKRKLGQARKDLESLAKESGKVSDERIARITAQLDVLPTIEWDTAVRDRNFLFHHFWYRADDRLLNIEGCQELKIRLEKYQKVFEIHVIRVRKELQAMMKILEYE